jgi:hypothetical protein
VEYKRKKNKQQTSSMLSFGKMNAVGVYGDSVVQTRKKIQEKKFDPTMFDEVAEEVRRDLLYGVFPRFLQSKFYQRLCRYLFNS